MERGVLPRDDETRAEYRDAVRLVLESNGATGVWNGNLNHQPTKITQGSDDYMQKHTMNPPELVSERGAINLPPCELKPATPHSSEQSPNISNGSTTQASRSITFTHTNSTLIKYPSSIIEETLLPDLGENQDLQNFFNEMENSFQVGLDAVGSDFNYDAGMFELDWTTHDSNLLTNQLECELERSDAMDEWKGNRDQDRNQGLSKP
jgi:hypothetical protein